MNRVIAMNYELKDADTGKVIESFLDKDPLYFITGFNHIFRELEDKVKDLKANEEKIIKISGTDAVGEHNPTLVQAFPKEDFAGIELFDGMELMGQAEDGSMTKAIVVGIGDEEVMMDFNHPFAGKNLEFNVKIVENRLATDEEIAAQRADVPHVCGCRSKADSHECCGGGHHHSDEHECCGGKGHHNDNHECCGGKGHNHNDDGDECCSHDDNHECCGGHHHNH